MLKWGNTEVTAVKWGNTNVTVVKWGNTVVFPTNNGFDVNSGTFVAPIASGLYYFKNFGNTTGNDTLVSGTALTGDKTSLAYNSSSRITFVSKSALTAAQWNALKQVRIVARWIVYNGSMTLDSSIYFSAASNSSVGMTIEMNKDSNATAYTGNSSNATAWANCSGWLNPWQSSYYYSSSQWCGQSQSITGSVPQGNNVIATYILTVANVTRFPASAYLGISQRLNVSSSPASGAYKYFRVELQSIEFLTSIKY